MIERTGSEGLLGGKGLCVSRGIISVYRRWNVFEDGKMDWEICFSSGFQGRGCLFGRQLG